MWVTPMSEPMNEVLVKAECFAREFAPQICIRLSDNERKTMTAYLAAAYSAGYRDASRDFCEADKYLHSAKGQS